MITTLSSYPGFSHYIWSPGFQWRHGDIAVYDEGGGRYGHTFFYAENVRGYNATSLNWSTADGTTSLLSSAIIEASSSRGWVDPDTDEPIPGDQDNGYGLHPEVWVHQYTDPSSAHTWHIFRWDAGPGPGPIPLTFEQQIALYSTKNRRRKDESIRMTDDLATDPGDPTPDPAPDPEPDPTPDPAPDQSNNDGNKILQDQITNLTKTVEQLVKAQQSQNRAQTNTQIVTKTTDEILAGLINPSK